jgi:tetratricopeptide (TPR) repeat protein
MGRNNSYLCSLLDILPIPPYICRMSRKNHSFLILIAAAAILSILPEVSLASSSADERETITKIVLQIQKADYEDDRPALQRLYGELAPFAETRDLAARVLYWRGFALWRKAINGFNDSIEKNELQRDLQQAAEEFEKSASADPSFVDAKIALGSCYGYLAYSMNKKDATELQALLAKSLQSITEAKAAAPDNPRLLWVLGPIYWNIPVDRGGGQDKAMDTYEKGLEIIRSHKGRTSDSLDPVWGEPELLMSLAWSNLNRATPDLKSAEQNAQAALALVPYWHYVRDILMKQIRDAKAKQSGTS